MFTVAASGTTRAPFLIDMARDLSASVPLIANLVAITSVAWGITSIFAGAGSDRWGTRPFLIGGPLGLAAGDDRRGDRRQLPRRSPPGPRLPAVAAACSAALIFTEVSSRVLPTQQGRALGWVMSGQSLTLLVGVPLAAWVGSWIGWRGVNVCIAGLALITVAQPAGHHRQADARRSRSAAGARAIDARGAVAAGAAAARAWGSPSASATAWSRCITRPSCNRPTALSLEAVALPLACSRSATSSARCWAASLPTGCPIAWPSSPRRCWPPALAALALFGWQMDVQTSVALGFGYVFFNAIARPSLMASLSDVPEHVRGTVMGLNVTSNSIGWLGAAALGGWMIGSFGFAGFGPLAAAVAVIGGGLALIGRR